ncbi:MAG: hypothetical protein ACJ74H_18440, partial [Thermoanaerobaculia bacterium]
MIIPVMAAAKKKREAQEAPSPVKDRNPVESGIEMRGGPRRHANPVSILAALIVWTIGIVVSV